MVTVVLDGAPMEAPPGFDSPRTKVSFPSPSLSLTTGMVSVFVASFAAKKRVPATGPKSPGSLAFPPMTP